MPDFCGTCKAPVLWTVTPAGKKAPIDAFTPDLAKGNTVLLKTQALPGSVLSIVLSGEALVGARERGAVLYTNHWATCPDREQWRERTDARKAASGGASD